MLFDGPRPDLKKPGQPTAAGSPGDPVRGTAAQQRKEAYTKAGIDWVMSESEQDFLGIKLARWVQAWPAAGRTLGTPRILHLPTRHSDAVDWRPRRCLPPQVSAPHPPG